MANHWKELARRGHGDYTPERFLEDTLSGKHHQTGDKPADGPIETYPYPTSPTEGLTNFNDRKRIVDDLGISEIEKEAAPQVLNAQLELEERFKALIASGFELSDFQDIKIAEHLLQKNYDIKINNYTRPVQNELRLSVLYENGLLDDLLRNLSITTEGKGAYVHLPPRARVLTGDKIRGEAVYKLFHGGNIPAEVNRIGQRMANHGFNP